MLLYLWITAIVVTAYLHFKDIYSRFSRHGVKSITPIPLLGNMGKLVMQQEHFTENIDKIYNGFPGERFVGWFEFMNTKLMVRDIELIKKIAIKDFEHFLDHRSLIDEKTDPLFGRNLISLKGQEWKDMRSTLSPAFTSSKIRLMVPFMVKVGDQMIAALKNKCKQSQEGYIDIEVKDMTSRYATDVIASCAFGLKVDSHMEVDNQFFAHGKKTSTFSRVQLCLILLFATFPKLMKVFKLSLISDASKSFFRNLVMSTMNDREERKIIRPDMIHLLMEAKKGKLTHEDTETQKDVDAGFATVEESAVGKKNISREWSDDDLIAQAVLFFIAGFETVSSAMSFLLHELAVNPDVQAKLYREIMENEEKNGGKFDYNSIQHMQYMDMVVSEILRLWSPAIILDRVCLKDYNLGRPNDNASQDYIIRKGDSINIPVWSIHRNPDYFPDPLKFIPERFSDENKHKIKPFTYMPFGLGPRNCIGSRFALCEVKVMVYQLLKELELSVCAKTCIPAKLSMEKFSIQLEGGHWVRMTPRN